MEPTLYLSKAGIAELLVVHPHTVHYWGRNGWLCDPDVVVGKVSGWSAERARAFGEHRDAGWTGDTSTFWRVRTAHYLTYGDAARTLGWKRASMHQASMRGTAPRPTVVISKWHRPDAEKLVTGLLRGDTPGFSERAIIEFGQQEGRLDANGRLVPSLRSKAA